MGLGRQEVDLVGNSMRSTLQMPEPSRGWMCEAQHLRNLPKEE